jgi:hypothetical protein
MPMLLLFRARVGFGTASKSSSSSFATASVSTDFRFLLKGLSVEFCLEDLGAATDAEAEDDDEEIEDEERPIMNCSIVLCLGAVGGFLVDFFDG